VAYVPASYNPNLSYGVVVWLHPSGGYQQAELLERWRERCDKNDLILLAPKSADPARWQPAEARFVRQALDEVLKTYRVDASRVVVFGQEVGGSLGYVVAFGNTDVVRGVATIASPMPLRIAVPDNDPVHRLAFYTATAAKAPFATLIDAGVKRLREAKFPVTVKEIGDQPRNLTDDELSELVRWIDTLDRL
jgi:poly(3-hydroxybutyrate) depolymerase